jgi:hypothetical protein
MMRVFNWVVTLAAISTVWSGAARASLVATGRVNAGGYEALLQYSSTGQYLGRAGLFSEEFNSVALGPDGKFYVIENIIGAGGVLRVTAGVPSSLETLVQVDFNSPFKVPSGLAFDPVGRLYVGSNSLGTVGDPAIYRVGSSGLTRVMGLPTGTPLLWDIEFDSAGNLFVAIDGQGVRRFPGTVPLPTFTIPVSTRDFDFGPDGRLYAATPTQGVLEFDPTTGAPLGTFIPAGSQGLVDAHDMVFGGDGVLYVNSQGAKKILKYDALTGAPLGTFTTYGEGRGLDITSMAYTDLPLPEPASVGLVAAAMVWWTAARPRRLSRAG